MNYGTGHLKPNQKEVAMKHNVGIWLDHSKTVIVGLYNDKVSTEVINSHVEGHFSLIGGTGAAVPYSTQSVSPELKLYHKHQQHLSGYYDKVINCIQTADKIYIIGPGQAKNELKHEICSRKDMKDKVVKVEAAGKMSDNQLVAKVKLFLYQEKKGLCLYPPEESIDIYVISPNIA